jgi:hypothetical protein
MTVVMKHLNPYRIAAALLVFFCVMHTAGGMFSHRSLGPAADELSAAMRSVHFTVMGADCTFHGFSFGYGLMVSVFLLFAALVSWHLGGATAEQRANLSPVAWGLFASQVATAVLSWAYFFPGPGVTSTVIAALLGFARGGAPAAAPART